MRDGTAVVGNRSAEAPTTTVLDLGCGQAKHEGALGVDIAAHAHADIVHNLNEYPYPLPGNHFSKIYCQDIIEHIDDTSAFVRELHRLCAPDARIEIRTPHYSSWYAYNDPTHKHYFGFHFLDLYVRPSTLTPRPLFAYVERRFLFPRLHRVSGVSWLAHRFPARYEQLAAFLFPCENLEISIRALKDDAGAERR